jgi:hypothetical protein
MAEILGISTNFQWFVEDINCWLLPARRYALKKAASTCTFPLKIARTPHFLAVLQSFAALFVFFSGMSMKKSWCAVSFVNRMQHIALSNCH